MYHDEGRITVDRYLDAVSQWATAIAVEGQCKTTYNNSIVALEEAKGTLLEHDGITVIDGPKSGLSIAGPRDPAVKAAWYEPLVSAKQTAPDVHAPIPSTAGKPQAKPANTSNESGAKTVSFQFTIGTGSRPIEIRGSFTITPAQPADATSVR